MSKILIENLSRTHPSAISSLEEKQSITYLLAFFSLLHSYHRDSFGEVAWTIQMLFLGAAKNAAHGRSIVAFESARAQVPGGSLLALADTADCNTEAPC